MDVLWLPAHHDIVFLISSRHIDELCKHRMYITIACMDTAQLVYCCLKWLLWVPVVIAVVGLY